MAVGMGECREKVRAGFIEVRCSLICGRECLGGREGTMGDRGECFGALTNGFIEDDPTGWETA